MEEQTAIAITKPHNTDANLDVFGSGFEQAQRVAKALSRSVFVPPAYQGDEGIPNCMIAMDMATRTRMGILAIMQSMYIVNGRPAFEAKYVSAVVNACGKYSQLKAICNEKQGDDYGYYAEATELATGEKLTGITVDWRMVKAEGWNQKKGSKWLTMPEIMFRYRAKAFWQRDFDPGLTMGIQTVEEAEDITVDIEKVPSPTLETVIAANEAKVAEAVPAAAEQPNKTQQDIQKAKQSQVAETEALRVAVIDRAQQTWGDQAMIKLGQLMRGMGTSISDAGIDALNETMNSIANEVL